MGIRWNWLKTLDGYECEKDGTKYIVEKGSLGYTKRTSWWVSIFRNRAIIREYVRFDTLTQAKQYCYAFGKKGNQQ